MTIASYPTRSALAKEQNDVLAAIRPATETYSAAEQKAQADFQTKVGSVRLALDKQIAAAKEVYLHELEAAIKEATCSGNFERTTELKAVRQMLQDPAANASVEPPSNTYLSKLEHFDSLAFEDMFGKSGTCRNIFKITVDGNYSPNGIALVPSSQTFSKVQFHLDRKYAKFLSGTALDDCCQGYALGKISFEVLGDGKTLWKGAPIANWKTIYDCSINVSSVQVLELRVNCPGSNAGQFAVWTEPQLIRKPRALSLADRSAEASYQRTRASAISDCLAVEQKHAAELLKTLAAAKAAYAQAIDAAIKESLHAGDQKAVKQLSDLKRTVPIPSTPPPAPPPPGPPVYLCDLEPFEMSAANNIFTKNGVFQNGIKIMVDGTYSPNGIGLFPPDHGTAKVQFHLDQKFAAFMTDVALNDSSGGHQQGAITFEVFGDGRLLWQSPPVEKTKTRSSCWVLVMGVRTLELRVNCPGMDQSQHAVWLEPKLVR